MQSISEAIFREMKYCQKIIKHFNKNLVMSVEDEKRFESSSKCWMCNKLFAAEDNRVGNHDHITGKYRGSAHGSNDFNLKLTKKVLVIFHNLKGYDSHLIMQEIGKFHISVTPNGLEKYMAFTIIISLFFIDSMQFMNSGLDISVKHLSDNDFKYLS